MNKLKIWTFLLAGMAAGLLLTGCSPKEAHEKALRQRAVELHKSIVKEDWEACQKMADPDVVAKRGTEMVKGLFKIVGGLLKLGKVGAEDYRVDTVVLAEDFKTAEVKGSNRINGEWKPAQPSKWVQVKGQWYVTL